MADVSMLVAEWKAENAGLRAAWEQAVAERDSLIEAQRVSEADIRVGNEEHAALLADWTEAKAELEEWRRDYDRGTRMSDLSAEVRSEINHWQGRAERAEAEIARMELGALKAEAEVARLRKALTDTTEALAKFVNTNAETREPYETALSAYDRGIAALKPNTGEQP